MGIRSFAKRLSTPVSELDAAALRSFCSEQTDCVPIKNLVPRQEASVVGEISSVRIVTHQGSPWLEATLSDGEADIVVMWTGRREIAGVTPGRRMLVSGRFAATRLANKSLKLMNPSYELLPKR